MKGNKIKQKLSEGIRALYHVLLKTPLQAPQAQQAQWHGKKFILKSIFLRGVWMGIMYKIVVPKT